MHPRIETPRLLLRFTELEDVDPVAAMWACPHVMHYMGGPRDFDEVAAMVREEAESGTTERVASWTIVDRESGAVVGDIGLQRKEIEGRDEIEFLYMVAHEYWGRGYCTEAADAVRAFAFESLGMTRLTALINPDNAASRRVAEKIGMHCEATIERAKGPRMLYVIERAVEDPAS